ncbi:MAG: hypothetical protein ACI9EV_001928, partial [Urechidicola sp.]
CFSRNLVCDNQEMGKRKYYCQQLSSNELHLVSSAQALRLMFIT